MGKFPVIRGRFKRLTDIIFILFPIIISTSLSAQSVPVLPNNGSFSQEMGPQGNLHFQRSFYLIRPDEMAKSELANNSLINALGFFIAAAQKDTTKGNFKVYLQNTSDFNCRIDTTWKIKTTTVARFDTSGLIPGAYEWQVQTVCGGAGNSPFSTITGFATADTNICNIPVNNITDSITHNSAVFRWTTPASSGFTKYYIRYNKVSTAVWVTDSTTNTYYKAIGLDANALYQWRVQTACTSGKSLESGAVFSTTNPNNCNSPSALTLGTIGATSAMLSWTAAAGATGYEIEYKRSGTSGWIGVTSPINSVTINGLLGGTIYDWRVKTVCPAGKGAFVYGPLITTTGSPVCYAPQNLRTNVVNDTSVILSWDSLSDATTYTIRYRLKNSISWDSAILPMTLVHCDSITIPDTIGLFKILFAGSGILPFTYTNNGLYIAWEYTARPGEVTTNNKVLASSVNYDLKDKNGLDSITYVLALKANNSPGASAHKKILLDTKIRPETWLGSANLQDSVEVVTVYAHGYHALSYIDTAHISAVIKNHSSVPNTYTITLKVVDKLSGMQRYTEQKDLTVEADSFALIRFNGWVPTIAETDSIIISVPARGPENVLLNNRNYYLQKVNHSLVAYDDGSGVLSNAGFGTSAGLILSRLKMTGCGSINAAQVYLDFSTREKEVYAVIMDDAGALLDSSEVFTPDSTQVNRYHNFYFPKAPFINDSHYYIGLAQKANAMPNFPVGVQWETPYIRDSAYYRANIDGTGLTHQPHPGRLMMRVELIPGRAIPIILGDLSLCPAEMDTLNVGSKTIRFANKVAVNGFSSEFSSAGFSAMQALGAPDVYPDHSFSDRQWVSTTADGQREYLVLHFPDPKPINYIDIYETLNPGAVDTVYVKNPMTGNFEVVYMAKAIKGPQIGTIKHISFDSTEFNVSEIRIAMASDSIPGYNGIDAVAIGFVRDSSDFLTYAWSNLETTKFIKISTADTYSVTVTDAAGCKSSASVIVTTPSLVPPVISIVGSTSTDSSFCIGGSVVLKSDKTSGNMWSTGATTDSIIVNSSGDYSLIYDDGTGCGDQTSDTIEITVNPLPTPAITGSLGICPSGSTTLAAGSYSAYEWSSLESTPTININYAGNFIVTVTDVNGCVGVSPSVSTFIVAPPEPDITGILDYCFSDSTTLDAGVFNSYNWSNMATTKTIIVKSPGKYKVTVSDGSGCKGIDSVIVIERPLPEPVITGTYSFCGGSSTQLNAGAGYASYLWNTAQTSQSIFVNVVGTYIVTVTDIYGCIGDTSAMVTEDGSIPNTPGPITGPTSVNGDSIKIQYSISSVPNSTYYVWTVPEGVTIVGSDDSTVLVLTIDSLTSGEIMVEAGNACGLSPSSNPSLIDFQLPNFGDCNQVEYINNSDPIPTGEYLGKLISSAGYVRNNGVVIFKPITVVNININFTVDQGAIFQVLQADCNN